MIREEGLLVIILYICYYTYYTYTIIEIYLNELNQDNIHYFNRLRNSSMLRPVDLIIDLRVLLSSSLCNGTVTGGLSLCYSMI